MAANKGLLSMYELADQKVHILDDLPVASPSLEKQIAKEHGIANKPKLVTDTKIWDNHRKVTEDLQQREEVKQLLGDFATADKAIVDMFCKCAIAGECNGLQALHYVMHNRHRLVQSISNKMARSIATAFQSMAPPQIK